jgi:hypothetical protein
MRFRDVVIRNVASPYGLAAVSLLFFLFAWTFPPGLYTRYADEPDLMFLDPASLLFFLLCVLAFVVGLAVVDFFFPVRGLSRAKIATRISPMWFLLLPLIAGTAPTVYSCILLLRNNVNLLEFLFAADAARLKAEGGMDISGTLGLASVALMGITWWAIWRSHQLDLHGWRSFAVRFAIIAATASMLTSAVLKVGRGEFMPILAGIAILFLLGKHVEGKLTPASLFRHSTAFAALIVLLFLAFSMLRGSVGGERLASEMVGYTISSYNRLAAILNGRLRYPFSGRGLYLSAFVAFNDTFNKVFHVSRIFAWPDFDTVWQSEFAAVSGAGLNGFMIWSGSFGYIFSDLGWFSPLLLFVYGLMTGTVWRWLKLDRTLGVILYPWFAFCILFWFGTNYLFDTKAFVLLLDASFLACYERILARTSPEVTQQ